jgi:propionyl-CoA synthetase
MDDARARYDALYRRSLEDPEAFWLEAAARLDWTRAPDRALELR